MQELECQFKADGGTFEEFRVGDLFEIKTTRGIDEGKLILSEIKKDDFVEFVGRTRENNGIKGYVPFISGISPNDKNVISVSQVGTITAQIRKNQWYASQNIFILKATEERLISFYALCSINKSLSGRFSDGYANYPTLEKLNELKIFLPITSIGEIDFDFMESVIRELQNESIIKLNDYLKSNGFDKTKLSKEEKDAVLQLRNGEVEWKEFRYDKIFDHIEQGRRLKKDDQKPGNIPFVMSGVTNTGVVNYISNPVASFPANSITVDIFGNTFYRDFAYGLGDDTGAYYNDAKQYTKEQMLFLASTIGKSLEGKYSYGNKLRSSQSLDFKMCLPVTADGAIDWNFMQNLIIAESRLAIRGVVEWKDKV